MATYVIGDVHGCYDPLCRLLDTIKFSESDDRLWFTGDLVNRGPQSLDTLRFVKSLGESCITVLGNHDIHLLALHYEVRQRKDKDNTLFQVLDAYDAKELISWLQHLPIIHIENEYILVHAGIHPMWSLETIYKLKKELEPAIQSARSKNALAALYGNTEGAWSDSENFTERLLYALNCLTRMRYCDKQATPDYSCNGTPGSQPAHLVPWFEINNQAVANHTILFGHWAALGYQQHNNIYALDTGCAWGNELTALRLEDKKVFSVSSEI